MTENEKMNDWIEETADCLNECFPNYRCAAFAFAVGDEIISKIVISDDLDAIAMMNSLSQNLAFAYLKRNMNEKPFKKLIEQCRLTDEDAGARVAYVITAITLKSLEKKFDDAETINAVKEYLDKALDERQNKEIKEMIEGMYSE